LKSICRNILAASKSGDQTKTIVVGAHLDSVDNSPGLNDNGSGAAALLSMATLFDSWRIQNNNKSVSSCLSLSFSWY